MMATPVRWALVGVLFLVAGATVVGCAGQTFTADTEPAGAMLTARDAAGRTLRSGLAPLQVPANFDAGPVTLVASPTPEQQETKVATEARFGAAEVASAPGNRVVVRLRDREYVNIAYLEPIYRDGGVQGLVALARAFENITETGGAVPTRLLDLGTGVGVQGMTISPDGQRLVYSLVRPAEPGDARQMGLTQPIVDVGVNLRGISTVGGGISQITSENFKDQFPWFTADGQFLLFNSNRRRSEGSDLLRMPASGRGGVANVYVDTSANLAVKPTQAEDGTIAFCLYTDPTQRSTGQIWTVGGPAQFPTQIATGTEPVIHPDGSHVAYIGDDGNVWICRIDGTDKTQLTFGAQEIRRRYEQSLTNVEKQRLREAINAGTGVRPYGFPSWSNDGRYLLFTSMQGNDSTGRPNEDIWIMEVDDGTPQQLTTNGSSDRYPLMSPDNRSIYLLSNRGKSWGIWRIPFRPGE